MGFRGYLPQNENLSHTVNTRVYEAQIDTVAIVLTGMPRVVFVTTEGASTRQIKEIVPKIKVSDITDLTTLPPTGVIITDGAADAIVDVCQSGYVGGFDTSSLAANDVLYLTTNGNLTTTRPKEDFVVQMGKVATVDASNGIIMIDQQVYPNPERYYGGLSVDGNATATTFALDTLTQFEEFDTVEVKSNTVPSVAESHIEIEKDGVYEVHCVITATGGNQKIFVFQIYKNNGATALDNLISSERVVQINDPATVTLSGQIEALDGDTLELWIISANGTSVTLTEVSFDLNRIAPIP